MQPTSTKLSGRRPLIVGETDLASQNPQLAAQWHPTKNDKQPSEVSARGAYKAWWQCDLGHEWRVSVNNRATGSTGCPFCAGQRVLAGYNDLATLEPLLAAEWAQNNSRTPQDVTVKSGYKAAWLCASGHEWTASVASRAGRGRGCPFCAGQRVIAGENDLGTLNPDVASRWHPDLNASDPSAVMSGTRMKAWWMCPSGHAYQSAVVAQVRGDGCAVCAGKQVSAGSNDLATLRPDLAAEWDSRNDLSPSEVTTGSQRTFWWKCPRGHRWPASVKNRTRGGTGCSVCAGHTVLPGFNDLATLRPDLAAEWHPENKHTPESVTVSSHTPTLWTCAKHHKWSAPVYSRTNGTSGCPECAAQNYSSKFETEVCDFIAGLLPEVDVQRNVRRFKASGIPELDIYIPSLNIAVEANGTYYHSERFKKPGAHRERFDACTALGIRLIQVWEDDWSVRRPTVEAMLAHRLGVSSAPRLYARQAVAGYTTSVEARAFLERHHIQGFTSGTHYVALRSLAGELAAVAVFRKTEASGKTLRLERYATSMHVIGGHSKVIAFLERDVPGWESLVTFADLEVSQGDLYECTGWVRDGEISPDYRYLVRGRRVHKFGYRLARFRNDPKLKFEEGMTERELAALNGLYRVWDSGKIRYRYTRS